MDSCSDTDVLSDNDFTVPGQTFVVDILLNRWLSNELALSFDGVAERLGQSQAQSADPDRGAEPTSPSATPR